MAQSEGFKHITVTPAEDEDVVIMAGVSAQSEKPAGEQPLPEPDETPDPAPETGLDPKAEPEPKPKPEPKPAPRPASRKGSAKKSYRATTLEDLQPKPMPFAQKVVIIAAVVCIIGALIYYFTFMR